MLTQQQIAQQMIAQLRVLDPSVSAEIGTPERKILDTVAQTIAEAGVDLNVLGGSLDIASKFGSDLDAYVGLFGFGRQGGSTATGFVTFSRPTASPYPITIPRGTQISSSTANGNVTFQTSDLATLNTGNTTVIAPIQALLPGSAGNVAANTINLFSNIGAPPLGITTVTNQYPTTGGSDSESDVELKVRFKNTVFRNMAGTEDQYLALALSTQYSTKANVIGPISRYQEYFQIPIVDDYQTGGPVATVTGTMTADSPIVTEATATGGVPLVGNEIISSNFPAGTTIIDMTLVITSGPTYTYTITMSNSALANSSSPFTVITDEENNGPGNGISGHWTTSVSNNPYAKYIYSDNPYFMSNGGAGVGTVFYNAGVDFVINAPPANLGDTYREFEMSEIPNPSTIPNNPNFTLYNTYIGGDSSVQLPTPGSVVLCEYSYLSAESRNDITRNLLNCVDVYVNGSNPLVGTAVLTPPSGTTHIFNNNPVDPLYYLNFSRFGQPTTHPVPNQNIFQPLFFQPTIDLPDQIVVGNYTYFLGQHYFGVQDNTLLGGTVRARNGIEWNPTVNGMSSSDPVGGPYTGPTIIATGLSSYTVAGYTYDRNIIDLQAAIDGAKQITTDVLAHAAITRYFKLDMTIVYTAGNLPASVNPNIQTAIENYFNGQYFGSTILLTDLLLTTLQVSGVGNVRWTNDVIDPSVLYTDLGGVIYRVYECDVNGNLLSGSQYKFDTDFYLKDNQLPSLPTGQVAGDTLPGLILRPRAENVFNFV